MMAQFVLEQGASHALQKKFCKASGAEMRLVAEHTLVEGVQKRILSYMPPFIFRYGAFDMAYMTGFDNGEMKGTAWLREGRASAAFGEELVHVFDTCSLPEHGMDLACIGEIFVDAILETNGDVDTSELVCLVGKGDDWVQIPCRRWVDLKKYPVELSHARICLKAHMTLYEPDKTEVCSAAVITNLRGVQTR